MNVVNVKDGVSNNNGWIRYWKNWKLHREDGPAVIYEGGSESWYYNGRLHRSNGPAVIVTNYGSEWYKHGKLHRLDGPAIINVDVGSQWYFEDELINCSSQEEFEKLIKLKAFW